MLRPAGASGERGAVLVLTALLLVVMLGFAAIAVDAAGAWAEKREVQTAADMGSLAAIQEIPRTLRDEALANSAAAGADFVTRNSSAAPTVGEPTSGPSCAARPRGFTRVCWTNIVVDADGSSDNSFAPAIGGGSSVDVPAGAEAQIDIEYPAMRLLPIGVSSVAGQRLRCAATGGPLPGTPPVPQCAVFPFNGPPPDPLPDPLPDPVPFGNNDVELLGIRRLDLGCGGLDTNAAETTNANLQLGVDHLVDDDLSAPSILELPACEQGHELTLPNTFRPGLPPTIAQDGMRQLLSGPEELWNFLSPGNLNVLCQPSMYTNIRHPDPVVVFTARTVLLNLCLSSDPPDPFNLPSGGHRRLGWAVDTEGSRVGGYVPVWVHSLVDGFMTPQSASPSGFSVFVLDSSWLPSNLTEVDPGGVDNLTFKLVE